MRNLFIICLILTLLGQVLMKKGCGCRSRNTKPTKSTRKSSYQPTSCVDCQYPSSCINATTINYTVGDQARSSPKYISSVSNANTNRESDGACNTFINAGNDVYILFRTSSFKNGTIKIRKSIVLNDKNYPGRYLAIGTTGNSGNAFFVGYEYAIAKASKPSNTVGYYRCNIYEGCGANDNLSEFDRIPIISSSPNVSDSCMEEVQRAVTSSSDNFNIPGFNSPDYSNTKCVCSLNGINVINRDRILNENCVSLPQQY